MRFLREGLALLAGVVGFVLGALGSLAVLMRLLIPDGDCQSPCDGPAYIAMWIGVFVAPVGGGICGGLAYCGMAYWNKRQ